MWLVVGGPLLVVVAAIVTAFLALGSADPVVDPNYYRHGIEINRTLRPALNARNTAAADAAKAAAEAKAAADRQLPAVVPGERPVDNHDAVVAGSPPRAP